MLKSLKSLFSLYKQETFKSALALMNQKQYAQSLDLLLLLQA